MTTRTSSRWMIAVLGIAAAACGGGDADDAADAAVPIDSTPAPGHVVYLAFEGVALTPGPDSPSGNVTSMLTAAYTVPPYLTGSPDRMATITAAVAAATTALAPYDIAVVTTRPTSGNYSMIVFGGDAVAAGFPAGVSAVAPFTCTPNGRVIVMVFDLVSDPEDAASLSVGAIGVTHGVPFSDVAGDCMCWASTACMPDGTMCTIGGAGTSVDETNWSCSAATMMDEHAEFLRVLGAAP